MCKNSLTELIHEADLDRLYIYNRYVVFENVTESMIFENRFITRRAVEIEISLNKEQSK